uniref:Uncharacterized protein n=1 Tax=Pipistrellus kuhlii TaxID=59472 RepID=A0A7J8B1P3_PIPKU|nr:hypothetical protein mPipKuh1_007817 [Pipistrellus kuhlii]
MAGFIHVGGVRMRKRGFWEEGTDQEEEILEENPRKLILLAENRGAERRDGLPREGERPRQHVPLGRAQACPRCFLTPFRLSLQKGENDCLPPSFSSSPSSGDINHCCGRRSAGIQHVSHHLK